MVHSNLKSLIGRDCRFRNPIGGKASGLKLNIKMILAFGAVYFIWGSTYLAIRFAIETIPPFFMMGCRSLLAGAILYTWARLRGEERPQPTQWLTAAALSTLLFVGGHGALAWSEQVVSSGVAALMSATTPIWMILLQALLHHDNPLTGRVIIGLVSGFIGVVLLAEPSKVLGGLPVDLIGASVLLFGTLSWSIGAVYVKNANLPKSSTLAAGMNLMCGGGGLLILSLLSSETVAPTSVSLRSLASFLYLIAFGSIITFTAYIWLIKKTSPAQASTHAFVNPVIAILVGWLAGGEPLSPRIITTTLLMVIGVAAIVTQNPTTQSSINKLKHGKTISNKKLLKRLSSLE